MTDHPPPGAPATNVWRQATSTNGGRWAIGIAAGALALLMVLGIAVAGLLVLRYHDRFSMWGQRRGGGRAGDVVWRGERAGEAAVRHRADEAPGALDPNGARDDDVERVGRLAFVDEHGSGGHRAVASKCRHGLQAPWIEPGKDRQPSEGVGRTVHDLASIAAGSYP